MKEFLIWVSNIKLSQLIIERIQTHGAHLYVHTYVCTMKCIPNYKITYNEIKP